MPRKASGKDGTLAGLVSRGARRLMGGPEPPQGVRVARRSARDRLDCMSEALAWAEAGEQGRASEVLRRESQGRRRVLVVSRGPGLAPRLAEFALGLAGRMGAEAVFLSALPPARSRSRADQGLQDQARRDAAANARPWLDQAGVRGVPAAHLVRFGDPAAAAAEACTELGRVEIVLSEPEEAGAVGLRAHRPVFTVA
ncbi:MAG: hypothetical protein AB1916_11700 [Thermodesulfobacteriota bacterium]